MDRTYWQKQTLEKPLFDEIIWNKPQRKSLAGNLLIVGGNLHAIAAPSEAFNIALNQGIGECRVVMPDATRKLLGPKPPAEIELISSNPSGSFSSKSKDDLKMFASNAEGILFAGDSGHSSETAIFFDESLKLTNMNIYCQDAAEHFAAVPLPILRRDNTLLVLNIALLQKFGVNANISKPFTHNMELMQLVERLHEFTNLFKCHILTTSNGFVIAAGSGQVVTTAQKKLPQNWQVVYAAAAAVWWLQNPKKPLEAIATAVTQV